MSENSTISASLLHIYISHDMFIVFLYTNQIEINGEARTRIHFCYYER